MSATDRQEATLPVALLDLENIQGAAKTLQGQLRSRPDLLSEDLFADIRELRQKIIHL